MEINTKRINTWNIRFDLGGEVYTRKDYEIAVYRNDKTVKGKMVITYQIVVTWAIWEVRAENIVQTIASDIKSYDFTTYFEMDSKYQHLCLKAFSEAMSKRQVY